MLAGPFRVLAAWGTVMALLAGAGGALGGALDPATLETPGTSSSRAAELAERHFGETEPVSILLSGAPGRIRDGVRRVTKRLRLEPDLRLLSPLDRQRGAGDLAPRPGVALVAVGIAADRGDAVRDRADDVARLVDAAAPPGIERRVIGPGIVGREIADTALAAVARAELVAAPLLLVILLLVFRSLVAAAVPLLFGASTVLASTGGVALLAQVTSINAFASTMAGMMGLALGVDYSLLLVSRFREELAGGASSAQAAARTARRAGRTVVFAGVALSAAMLAATLLAPGGVLLSAMAGVLIAAIVSAAGARLALPAVLELLGERVNSLKLPSTLGVKRIGALDWLSRRPVLAAAGAVVLLAGAAVPASGLEIGPPDVSQLRAGNSVRKDVDALRERAGEGWAGPLVLVAAGDPSRVRLATGQLAREAERTPGAIATWTAPSPDGEAVQLNVIPEGGPNAASTRTLRDHFLQLESGPVLRGLEVGVGGQPSEFDDFRSELGGRFALLVVGVALTTTLVLLPILRSLPLALATAVLNLLAVGAALGLLTLLVEKVGLLHGPGWMDGVSLVTIYAVLFGLSIDYQMFVLSRIHEEHELGAGPAAVRVGLAQTAGIVTGAAAIMIAVFGAFGLADLVSSRQLGVGLAIAIFIDATIVRIMLLPAIVRLLGDRAWWLPALRIPFT
jgi:uncharacterized membrane protein YdfJ with MMPL/SSD domain